VKRRSPSAALSLAVLLLAACATAPPLPDLPDSHPASPQADAAPERAPSSSLTMPKPTAAPIEGAGGGHRR
jgi:hypothetical protein